MKKFTLVANGWSLSLLLAAVAAGSLTKAFAYPPAPHHLLYGMVRNEYGVPINTPGTQIIFEMEGGKQIRTTVIPDLEPGVNFRLEVPMDSGLTSSLYAPTAMRPTVPFRLKVKVGGTVYLPMEMHGDMARLGQPSQKTRLNLTLGEDSDGDGLPDAWERLINSDLSKVNPGEDSDHDGLTNAQEYLAGTYAFDPKDGFALKIEGITNGAPTLAFLALASRTYSIESSDDLKTWTPMHFRLTTDAAGDPLRSNYRSEDVHTVKVEARSASPTTCFRLVVH